MKITIFQTSIIATIFFLASPVHSYQLLTDATNGGNPKLDKKTYKVYVQADPTGNNRDQEVKEALNKWKSALAGKGVALEVQSGNPPETPIDLKKLNDEIKKFNQDPNPDLANYPEIQKSENKKCTISVYFETTAEIINRRGGGSERGFANNIWNFDENGKANKIESSDVFIASDPPGATEEVKKRITHNIALHEFGHTTGLDHYTPEQDKTGAVMETDATLHGTKLDLGSEENKGLDTLYGPTNKLKIDGKAESKPKSFLPGIIQDHIPTGLANVWEYNYDLLWLEGAPVSYFQIETGQAPIFFALGSEGLEDWLFQPPSANENYLEFFADQNYLGEDVFSGQLQFYTSYAPQEGWLVYAGGSERGLSPVPEPSTLFLMAFGLLNGALIFKKNFGQ